jgi:hypothetical protein
MISRSPVLGAVLGALVLAVAPLRTALAQSTTPDTVRVCVVPGTGTIYRLSPGTGACLNSSHTMMTWSAKGPQGDKGATGNVGPQGPTGPSGLPCVACINSASIADGAVTDSKFGVISQPGKVANSATTASSIPAGGTIVQRDADAGISAARISATAITASSLTSTGPISGTAISSNTIVATSTATVGGLGFGDGSVIINAGTAFMRMGGGVTIYSSPDLLNGVRLNPGSNNWFPVGGPPPLSEADGATIRSDLTAANKRVQELETANAALLRRVEDQDRRLAAIEAALGASAPAARTSKDRDPR